MIIKNPWIIGMLTSLLFCSTSCPDEEVPVSAKITDFFIDNCDNSGAQIKRSEVVPAKAYVMKITYVLTPDENEFYNYLPINECVLSDTITSLEIKTIKDLKPSYPAGSIINELFKSYTIELNNTVYKLTNSNYWYISDSEYYNALMLAPDVGIHQFEVTIVFKSGKTLSKTTQPVTIY